jgi:hypothetical protein
MFEWQRFLEDVARVADGDYAAAFKMLGFVLYVSEFGAERLLSGAMVSPRTYYRWVETIKAAGWEPLLLDARFEQALLEYVSARGGEVAEIKAAVLQKLNGLLAA